MQVRRTLATLLAVLSAAGVLAIAPLAPQAAQGEAEPTLAVSVTEGRTGSRIQVTGEGCYLPDGITGADGLLFQLIGADGRAAASATLAVGRDGSWNQRFTVPNGLAPGPYTIRGTCIAPMYEDLGVLTAGTYTVTGEGAPAPEAAPVTPQFPRQIEPYPAYDGQSTCSPTAKPGMIALRDLVMGTYPTTTSFGISRDCSIGGTSEHKEGRAWDWAVDATRAGDRAIADELINWLLRTDQYGHRHAMARRLGVMYIIWNRRIFRLYRVSDGWTPYTGSSPHTDHVHISLTRAGGRGETSFWALGLPGPDPDDPAPKAPTARFDQTEYDVRPTHDRALAGDFDGDGRQDIVWYGRGSRPDRLWWGRGGRAFDKTTFTLGRQLEPVTGDFDGDGRDDIYWFGPGEIPDRIWWGGPGRTWTRVAGEVPAPFANPVVGDFNGNGNDDLFWYGPGAAVDTVWFGRADRAFRSRDASVRGTYRPAVGDFNGNGRDDILWYAPGAAEDFVWWGRGDLTFSSSGITIDMTDREPIVGDYDDNGRDDIFFYAPGDTADRIWWGSQDKSFAKSDVTNVAGTYAPTLAADLDDNGHDDVFWYRPGTPLDYIWWFR